MPRQTTTPLPQFIYPRIINLRRRIKNLIYTPLLTSSTNNNNSNGDTSIKIYVGPTHKTFISWEEAIKETYNEINVGDSFSPASVTTIAKEGGEVKEFLWTQRWFRVDIQLPSDLQTKPEEELSLYFLAHGEYTVYTSTGDVWCGIDPVHDRIPLSSLIQQQQKSKDPTSSTLTIWLDGGQWQTGFWFGIQPPTDELGFRLLKVELQSKNIVANSTYHDISMLVEWIEYKYEKEGIPLNTENGYYQPLVNVPPSLRRMLHLMNLACDVYDKSSGSSIDALEQSLAELNKAIKAIYDVMTIDTSSNQDSHRLNMKICHVGHAHMDLVWLWPERVTYQKIIHTYSNVLQLMNSYPTFTFTMSQPPLYYHIKDKQPKLAKQIEEKINEGRWEFTGALEVECDTQIPVGEGLVRCILHGQDRIKAITGRKSATVWIPDVFGYTQCLPQIFSLAEIPNFFTTKILWSTISKFPHNSFIWIGPDGEESSVLTHLGVVGYSSKISMKEIMGAARSYQQADVHDEVLCPSGYGDGGGGTSDEQVERSLRLQNSFVGESPSCRWDTSSSFFKRLALVEDELPVYRGELFLEYHRAVHTTQSDFKYNLRACERALQTREALRVISGNFEPLKVSESWERYLFALFHDATPGSSIHSVYQELNAELSSLAERQLALAIEEWPSTEVEASPTSYTVINQLAWERFDVVELPADVQPEDDLLQGQIQLIKGKTYALVKLKGLSASPLSDQAIDTSTEMKATPSSLSNGIVNTEFDEYGQLCSLSVYGEHMLLSKGNASSSFSIHDDNPEAYDAWDMDHNIIWMKENAIKEPVVLRVAACGPVVSILRTDPIPIGINGSSMVIEYRLYAKQDSLQVSCSVDWKETHKTLRYQVATDYRGDVARFGAPFNFVDRSQIPQTHKEEGQWEVPASRWASILNGNGDGLSIITQSKYGFRAKMGTLSFSMLRSSTWPDPIADKGKHIIKFAISKHQNIFQHLDNGDIIPTAAKADELFTKPLVLPNSPITALPQPHIQFIELGSAVPSWIMPSLSEDNRGKSFCIRLHEVAGANTNVSFSLPMPNNNKVVGKVEIVNFNEKLLSELESIEGQETPLIYNVSVRAYKIVTIRVSYN